MRIVLLAFFNSITSSWSQCNPPDQIPTNYCETAPLICLLHACYQTIEDNFPDCCGGWCNGDFTIHNPQFFQMIATSTTIEIQISVLGCDDGTGLQGAIIDTCPWATTLDYPNIVECDGDESIGQTMVLLFEEAIIGNSYWLMIDGFGGALCDYEIPFVSGIYNPELVGELDPDESMAIPEVVCQGYQNVTVMASPAIGNAHGYIWVTEWNNETMVTTLPELQFDIPDDAPPGWSTICITPFSGCDTADVPLCVPIFIADVLNGEVDVVHCYNENFDPYYYEGEPYSSSGDYELSYPGMGLAGCDSLANLHLTLIGIDAIIELSCSNGEFVLTPIIQELSPADADIEWSWYEGGSNFVLGNEMSLSVEEDGCYDLFATIETVEGECTFLVGGESFCFNAIEYSPEAPEVNGDTVICAQDDVMFSVTEDPMGEMLQYVWSAPMGVPPFDNGSDTVEMDFTNSTGGQVCVYAINSCGEGPTTCFNVMIQSAPLASINFDGSICKDSAALIQFIGSASANALFTWNFDNPSSVSGSGIGPYNVTWASEGNKTVELSVVEPGCDTAFTSAIVIVTDLELPDIQCTSTINSILFDWNDIAGSSGYLVTLGNGTPFPVSASEYFVSSLLPGTSVQLILTVQTAGPCPNVTDTMNCIAQNCPPPTIELSGQDSVCLNNPTILDLEAMVNGSAGNGLWSGPGIVDPMAGLFDPLIAGPGTQQVVYIIDENGCIFNQPYTITVLDSIKVDFTLEDEACLTIPAFLRYMSNASPSANYIFDFDGATVTTGSVGTYYLLWPTTGLKTVTLQVSENGCTSEIFSKDIVVVRTLEAPTMNCFPTDSTVLFSWILDPIAFEHDIHPVTTQPYQSVNNTIEFSSLVPGEEVIIAFITFSGGPCPNRIDTFTCVARPCPMPVINVTPVNDICLYPGAGIVNLQVDVQNGTGAGEWSGPGIVDAVIGRFDPNVAGAGAHQITYHYVDDGCNFNNAININVYDPPVALISNTDFMITCATNSIFLDGSTSSGGNLDYLWTTIDGVIVPPANTSIVEASAKGTYQLLVINPATGCKDSTSVLVTVDANIPTADAGPDRTLTCDSTQFTLGGPTTTSGVNIVYSWTTTGGNIQGPTNGTHIVADKTGDYTIMVRDTATGCQASDLVTVSIDTVVATINLTPGDTIDCNTAISKVTSSLNEPVSDYVYTWSTLDGAISGAIDGQKIDVSQGGTYTLTIDNKRNGCVTSAVAFVPESDEIIDGLSVTATDIKCFGEGNGSLEITSVDGGVPPYTYLWSPGNSTSNSLTSLGPGQYNLTVSDNNGCSLVQTYTVVEPPLVTIDLGPNLTVAAQDSVTIAISTNLSPPAITKVEWSSYDGETCEGCLSFSFIATTSATISSIITDTAGCSAEDSMRLTVIIPRIIFIPNVFSPNGDGENDYFTVFGRFNLANIAKLNIYDRWGNQLFGKTDLPPNIENRGWDGRFHEQDMPPGVYVYTAELVYEDGVKETVTGNITLVR